MTVTFPPRHQYRVLYAALTDQTNILGELPVTSLSYTRTLNRAGTASFTVPLNYTVNALVDTATPTYRDISLLNYDAFTPGNTVIYVERDGTILFTGIMWAAQADIASMTLNCSVDGFLSYFYHRYLYSNRTYTAEDQTTIFADLIDHCLAFSDSPTVDTTSITASGVTRDRTYIGADLDSYGELLTNLSAVIGGFDFEIRGRWETGSPLIEAVTHYPNAGTNTNYVLHVGRNVEMVDVKIDGTNIANFVHGSAGGGTELNYTVNASTNSPYARLEAVVATSEARTRDTLNGYVSQRLNRGTEPVTIIAFNLAPDTEPELNTFNVGDRVRVVIEEGWLDIDETCRVTEIDVTVNETGTENVKVTTAPYILWTGNE